LAGAHSLASPEREREREREAVRERWVPQHASERRLLVLTFEPLTADR